MSLQDRQKYKTINDQDTKKRGDCIRYSLHTLRP